MKYIGFNSLIDTMKTIENYRNSIFVIKCSEEILYNEGYMSSFIENISLFLHAGIKIVIINDGFKECRNLLYSMGCTEDFKGKYRVIDENSMKIIEMASGKINKEISSKLSSFGIKSLGISGRECNLVRASKKKIIEDGIEIDAGFIGNIEGFNRKLVMDLLNMGVLPVISPVGSDCNGSAYILEPDYTAHYISVALKAEKLIIINGESENSSNCFFIKNNSRFNEEDLDCMNGINGNLKSDLDFAVRAISGGTREVYIIEGGDIDNMLPNIFSNDKRKIFR